MEEGNYVAKGKWRNRRRRKVQEKLNRRKRNSKGERRHFMSMENYEAEVSGEREREKYKRKIIIKGKNKGDVL